MRTLDDGVRELVESPWLGMHASWRCADLLPPGWQRLSAGSSQGLRRVAGLWRQHFGLTAVEPQLARRCVDALDGLEDSALASDAVRRAMDLLGMVALASRPDFAASWVAPRWHCPISRADPWWRVALRCARARPLVWVDAPVPSDVDGNEWPAARGLLYLRRLVEAASTDVWAWFQFRIDRRWLIDAAATPPAADPAVVRFTDATRRQILGIWMTAASLRASDAPVGASSAAGA